MVGSGDDESDQPADAAHEFGDAAVSIPARNLPKRFRLGTIREVKREQVAVYLDCRLGRMRWQDGDYAKGQLKELRQTIKDADWDSRLTEVERKLQGKP